MEPCLDLLTKEPAICLDLWQRAPGAYGEKLDRRHGIDPYCGTCLFVFCACCPLNPCCLVPAFLAEGCLPGAWLRYLCCPWLVSDDNAAEKQPEDMV